MAKEASHKKSGREEAAPKRIYRSRKDKLIAGVCGGIAEYAHIDPVWARLIAVLLIFANGIGILLYILAWVLIPKNPEQQESKATVAERAAERVTKKGERGQAAFIIGIVLVLLGVALLLHNLYSWFSFRYVWPAAIILIGIYLLVRGGNDE